MARENSASPTNPLGDVMNCPVCYEVYEGRIMMCHSGHAVCEKCQKQMSECPQCRAKYTGTRNYTMEEVVAKLKKLNLKVEPNDNATGSKKSAVEANETKKKKEKKKKENTPEVIAPTTNAIRTQINNLLNNERQVTFLNGMMMAGDSAISDRREIILGPTLRFQPVQIKGSHIRCEMLNCTAELPICRLYNHIRYYHKDNYTETKSEGELCEHTHIVETFNVPCRTYRHAIKVRDYGLFFLKINVSKNYGETSIHGWVQGTCSNRTARLYKYDMEITFGTVVAKYSDLCYGYNQNDEYVQLTGQCLNVSTHSNSRFMNIKLKMYRWYGTHGIERKVETNIETVAPTASRQPNQPNNRQQGQLQNRGKKQRNRRRN